MNVKQMGGQPEDIMPLRLCSIEYGCTISRKDNPIFNQEVSHRHRAVLKPEGDLPFLSIPF